MRSLASLRALAGAVAVTALAAACSGGTSIQAAPTSTTDAASARCTVYRQMASNDFRVSSQGALATTDWPRFRALLVDGNRQAEADYSALAKVATGALHDDAVRLAAFMPASRALVTRSVTFRRYRAELARLPGDAAVRAAAKRIFADARTTCSVTVAHPLATS